MSVNYKTAIKSKYKNTRCEFSGIQFDSIKEMGRYQYLKKLEDAGEITGLELQKRFELIPRQKGSNGKVILKADYVADFVYFRDLEMIVEDVKGVLTDVYKLKKKLMLFVHGIEITEI